CTITNGAGTNTITVSFSASATSGNVTVAGTNTACGVGLSASLPILTGLLPVAAGPITGLTSVCQGQTDVVYSIASVPGATSYIWTAPPGGVISAGQGTNAVTISFDSTATPGSVAVRGHSGCGDGPASSVSLTINPLPAPAGTITGSSTVCQSQNNVTYSIVPLSYTGSYLWTVPSGCTITSGSGTSQITVLFNTVAISGPITVRGINATCGAGRRNSINILVNPLPGATGTISGLTTVCQGEPGISYMVASPDPNTLSYSWNLSPANAGTVSSSTSPATVSWAELFTGQAFLTVAGMNGCGAGPVSNPLSITINPKPTVALAACFDLKTTKNSRPIRLSGGNPLGTSGSFSGTGVSQISPGVYAFDPGNSQVTVSAGGTPYEITYRYTNTYNCFREASRTITVFPSGAGQICPGTVTDLRDGQVYPTLLAGSGAAAKCWMARNLNYGEFLSNGQPQTDNCTIEKYCRNNLSSECSGYGGFYQWDELMQYQSGSYFQDLCPPGWHLPSEAEWTQFLASLGTGVYPPDGIAGSFLKDPNTSPGHFNALLGGVFYHGQSWALTTGTLAGTLFWTSTLTTDDRISVRGLNYNNPSVSRYFSTRENALPVRCVRD
ncbi:MAG TPA: FISUMP domain-containing protein, partial [Bacteroidales bacterium]|nr:FISUMP domain-containing protein [Bacteroidales bacterium]